MKIYSILFFFSVMNCLAVSQSQSMVLPIKKSGKWGLINESAQIITPATFDAMTSFDEYSYAKVQKDGAVGLLHQDGQLQLPLQFDDLQVLGKEFIEVRSANKIELVNATGKVILKDYDDLQLWNEELMSFKVEELWGLIDKNGAQVAAAEYESLESFKSFILVQKNQQKGLLNENGKVILPCIASDLKILYQNLILYKEQGNWGIKNHRGDAIVEPSYNSFREITPYLIVFQRENELAAFSLLTNKLVSAKAIESFEPFSKEYLLVKKENKYGLIHLNNNWVITPKYNEILAFTNDLLRCKSEQGWGIIDYQGRIILKNEFDYIAPVQQGISIIKKNGKYGILNATAQLILPPQYEKIEVNKLQIKAFKQGNLTLLYKNDDGTVSNKQVKLNNHLTFNIKSQNDKTEDQKRRLDEFEWYYNNLEGKWGLRSLEGGDDSIEPQFDYVEVKKELGFTLVGLNNGTRYEFNRTTYQFEQLFGLVNNKIGKLVTPIDFLHIYFEDFEQNYPIARCIFSNGKFGLVDTIGRVLLRDATYIGDFQEGLAPTAFYGKLSGATNTPFGLLPLMPFLQSLQTQYFMFDYTADDMAFNEKAWLTCESCIWGYINTNGKMSVPASYEFVLPFENKVALVLQSDKWGGIDSKGKTIINCEYDALNVLPQNEKQAALITHKSLPKYGVIDTLGNMIIEANYDEIGDVSEGKIAIRIGDLWGFVDQKGKVAISPKYDKVANYSEGVAAVEYRGKWGLVDHHDNIVLSFQYDDIGNLKEGLTWAKRGNNIVYLNKAGEVILKVAYSKVHDFKNDVARVVQAGKWGLIDRKGNEIVSPKFNHISPFNDFGLAVAQYGRERFRYGIINTQGQIITNHHYRYIYPFSEGLAAVKLKDKYGYINTIGNLVIPAIYSRTSPFIEGKAAVQQDGVCGYINRLGEVVVDFKYSKCLEFSSGKAVVYQGYRKAGLVNQKGQQVIQPSLNRLLNFEEGRGLMRDASYRFYFITEEANLYDGYYEAASSFQNGVAIVRIGNKWGVINKKGIKVIPPKYDNITAFKNGFAQIRIKGLYGLVNSNGDLLLPPKHEQIIPVGNDILRVEKGNAIGYIRTNGNWFWQLQN